jgi:hypothetical protein
VLFRLLQAPLARFSQCLHSHWTLIPFERNTVERRCHRTLDSPAPSSHARSLAARQRLDHSGFRQRGPVTSGAAAENVAYGCTTEDCVIRMWARSGAHRANMLRRDVTSYGLGSADSANGKRYWVLELGN